MNKYVAEKVKLINKYVAETVKLIRTLKPQPGPRSVCIYSIFVNLPLSTFCNILL